jgi:hypothetical protein
MGNGLTHYQTTSSLLCRGCTVHFVEKGCATRATLSQIAFSWNCYDTWITKAKRTNMNYSKHLSPSRAKWQKGTINIKEICMKDEKGRAAKSCVVLLCIYTNTTWISKQIASTVRIICCTQHINSIVANVIVSIMCYKCQNNKTYVFSAFNNITPVSTHTMDNYNSTLTCEKRFAWWNFKLGHSSTEIRDMYVYSWK